MCFYKANRSNLDLGTSPGEALLKHIQVSFNQWLIGALGPGGLDSDWIPENERDWDSEGVSLPKPPGPKPPINHELNTFLYIQKNNH